MSNAIIKYKVMKEYIISTLVLCENFIAKQVHKELFHYDDSLYIISHSNQIKEELIRIWKINNIESIHLCGSWNLLLRLALKKNDDLNRFSVIGLMKSAGLSEEELSIIKDFGDNDIFPWLYYSKRLNVLRKLCNIVKDNIKNNMDFKIEVHLISEDTKQIVASTL